MSNVTTATRPNKPSSPGRKSRTQRGGAPPPVTCEWVRRLGHDGTGLLAITRGAESTTYKVVEITSPLGEESVTVGFRFEKSDGTSYDLPVEGTSCECLGFLRWGHCRHLTALHELILSEPESAPHGCRVCGKRPADASEICGPCWDELLADMEASRSGRSFPDYDGADEAPF